MVSEVSATLVARIRRRWLPGIENALLIGQPEPCEQGQHLGERITPAVQHIGALADLALAGQEHQHIAARLDAIEHVHRPRHVLRQILVVIRRQEKLRHRKHPARRFDHRHRFAIAGEKRGERSGIERGGGNHQFQIPAFLQQPLEIA
jgi:hypothetical protein